MSVGIHMGYVEWILKGSHSVVDPKIQDLVQLYCKIFQQWAL